MSHSCVKTRYSSVHWHIFLDILTEITNFFDHFKIVSVYDRKMTEKKHIRPIN